MVLTKEEIKEIEKIKKETNEPKNEEKIVPLVNNGNQFKVAIPKKFADFVGLNKNKHLAKFVLDKKENKIYMEIENA